MLYSNNIYNKINKLYKSEYLSIFSISYFVFIWMTLGNIISLLYNINVLFLTNAFRFVYFIIYSSAIVLIIISLYKEINTLTSKYFKLLISFQFALFIPFIYSPPRNADSMRVWLAKIYDILLNGEKIHRPYVHYNTPDAFTLFHLPLIEIADGQVFQLSILACFASTIIILLKICNYYDNNYLSYICLLLFIFNPLITLGTTVVISDMPVILAFCGIMYSIISFSKDKSWALLLLLLFIAFALNIKYNSLLIIPALLYWSLINSKLILYRNLNVKFVFISVFILSNAFYPYIMNYIIIGNPVWPGLINIFPANNANWDIAASNLTHPFVNNERSITNLFLSFYNLLTIPHLINPIIILMIPFLFQRFKYVSYMPLIIIISYIFILWLIMPLFAVGDGRSRYILYLYPIIIPFGLIGFVNLFSNYKKYFKNIIYLVVILPSIVYFSFNIYYSKDALQYFIYSDKNKWHKHTWYYNDYKWINENIELKGNQKIMVYSSHQQTYYLREKYINIDPLSGYFKDKNIFDSVSGYIDEMKKFDISYIFIDMDVLDENNAKMINLLAARGNLVVIRDSNSFISISRLFDRGSFHRTILYKVNI